MPRPPRVVAPDQPLHIIQRGNNRATSFVASEDIIRYKSALREASVRCRCAVHAYVLMSNHVHLLVTPADEEGPSRMMQMIGRRYVRYFNDRYERTGTLWEGRYRSMVIDSHEYFFACSRYIELNPVRAGLARHPSAFRWSSFRHNAIGEPDSLVTTHALYEELGTTPADRRNAYSAMFASQLDDAVVNAIRRAANSGSVLGPPPFLRSVERQARRSLGRRLHGGDRRSESFQGLRPTP